MDGKKTRNNLLSLLFYNKFYFISFYTSVSSYLYHFFNNKKLRGRSRRPPDGGGPLPWHKCHHGSNGLERGTPRTMEVIHSHPLPSNNWRQELMVIDYDIVQGLGAVHKVRHAIFGQF